MKPMFTQEAQHEPKHKNYSKYWAACEQHISWDIKLPSGTNDDKEMLEIKYAEQSDVTPSFAENKSRYTSEAVL